MIANNVSSSILVILWLVLASSLGFFAGYLVQYQSSLQTINTYQVDLQRTGEERDAAAIKANECESKLDAVSIEMVTGR